MLERIFDNILENIINECKKDSNQKKIKLLIADPIMCYITDKMYPYIFITISVFVIILITIFLILLLIIKRQTY